ncbi:sulfonate/nitrate/taurine transport system ATP-binding [Dinoroseobacter shibae DFL 12 = DSM 16493]|jgi:NitT/TauT family transport system ATP-binding protein|uniref:Sulfonate/nitrate/taurine transport system ATP-binding n=1 Tax=Dinoroseobacter shibae (strain DSM 16493 / NCIMB 14021 / DFL 12) TaxID=398580 RepID=A8LNT3_DINSH|nr:MULTISPECIES: ATP-binding cassette domain-containing protein [Dinoroseobacter]ABV92241.1 sulfonate/nitrate/taurine transport system ATP-binding [Dinoroseobacter shibae DFL 12 = DSM 16493]MDD9717440.1 ATP-binding cassette domain-containing protein [Dinoroseobacter sp. PD6]URF47192.1 ATP-binding cassette domain-containing protein [Dinoroseobacter shibae]URF51503.1 ATP-binding cassette domain-containing protein [Dinoroseobacter shibae]
MTTLQLSGIGHAFLGRTVLDTIDLSVAQGEIVALVGPSGCGKSTLAHIAAGLIEARAGRISHGYTRHAMIFQDPALIPWATAAGNIDYVLRMARVPRAARPTRIAQAAAQVALLAEDLNKYPVELSGGMRQRVAIARALAIRPDFIYFDEPFTALDVALRRRMQDLVIATCAGGHLSGLFITHDLSEAARIAHRIAVLDTHGRGILGHRPLIGNPCDRSDDAVFDWVQTATHTDPIFRHIHDVDERQVA